MDRVGIYILFLAGAVIFVGCGPVKEEPVPICACEKTLEETILLLELQRENIKAIRAGGSCRIEWIDEKGKRRDENPTIDVRFVPPGKLYLKGDILGGEAFRVGTNEEEFWVRLKPKEISSYWWGRREYIERCGQELLLNPCAVNEALGAVEVDDGWDLIRSDGFDVLTMRADDGMPIKRVYVNCCDSRVSKIEYYNNSGFAAVVMELGDYTDGDDGIVVPSKITIGSYDYDKLVNKVELKLKNIKLFEPTEKQLKGKLFERAPSDGFENVYELDEECRFVKQ